MPTSFGVRLNKKAMCFGLRGAEWDEYVALENREHFTIEGSKRFEQLYRRTYYRWYPQPGKTVMKMIKTGFFLSRPGSEGDIYFETEDVKEYMKLHPVELRVWTLVNGEDNTQWLLQGWHTVNRFAHLIEKGDGR